MRRHTRRTLAALHPVAAAVNRRPLTPDELRAIEVAQSLALAAIAAGTATRAECMDVHDLLRIGVELARAGIGAELLDDLQALVLSLRQALTHHHPVAAVAPLLPRLLPMLAPLGAQRSMATMAEWMRAQALLVRPSRP